MIEGQRLLRRVDLPLADPVGVVEDLALKVGGVDHVHVDDADGPHSGGRQVEGGGRAQPARPQQEHLRVEELELPDLADLGQKKVALVAIALLGSERLGRRPVRGPRPSIG